MLMRLVFFLLIGGLLWLAWRKLMPRDADAPPPPPPAPGPEVMRRCAECGVHMPESQALPGRGGHFCSAAHRDQFETREPR